MLRGNQNLFIVGIFTYLVICYLRTPRLMGPILKKQSKGTNWMEFHLISYNHSTDHEFNSLSISVSLSFSYTHKKIILVWTFSAQKLRQKFEFSRFIICAHVLPQQKYWAIGSSFLVRQRSYWTTFYSMDNIIYSFYILLPCYYVCIQVWSKRIHYISVFDQSISILVMLDF